MWVKLKQRRNKDMKQNSIAPISAFRGKVRAPAFFEDRGENTPQGSQSVAVDSLNGRCPGRASGLAVKYFVAHATVHGAR